MSDRLTISHALSLLNDAPEDYKLLFSHGTLEVEIYKPGKVDLQQPHTRDEIYVINSGTGMFVNGEECHPFEPGEVLFVAAGVVHRFQDYSEDFSTWVIFYGPEGGEAG